MNRRVVISSIVVLIACITVTFCISKYVVIPVKTRLHNYSLTANKLEKENKKLKWQLADVKAVVRTNLNKTEAVFLEDYILHTTSNLTPNLAKDVAVSITEAAWKHKVPIEVAVGLAQAVTGFNPTYFDSYGNRGVLAYQASGNKKDLLPLHKPKNGADKALEHLSNILNMDWYTVRSVFESYFSNQPKLPVEEYKILLCTTEYLLFVYNKRRDKEDSFNTERVKGLVKLLEVREEKKEK